MDEDTDRPGTDLRREGALDAPDRRVLGSGHSHALRAQAAPGRGGELNRHGPHVGARSAGCGVGDHHLVELIARGRDADCRVDVRGPGGPVQVSRLIRRIRQGRHPAGSRLDREHRRSDGHRHEADESRGSRSGPAPYEQEVDRTDGDGHREERRLGQDQVSVLAGDDVARRADHDG